ncbi:MAG TPA: cysteine desulfurase family protein [Limnochordales bacterium]
MPDATTPLIYLDHAATTPVRPEVVQAMTAVLQDPLAAGNPSSRHRLGARAREALDEARRQVAALLGAPEERIVFTGSATEANNLALLGAARAAGRRGRHLVISAIEHPSVMEAAALLQSQGYRVTRIAPSREGIVDAEAVARAVEDDTFLVSVMLVNNETGALQPVGEVARLVRRRRPEVLVHSDVVQAAGRLPLDVEALGVDLATISAHKLHGPKGVGALYVGPRARLDPLVVGGGQERGLRSGTENIPGIVGFGVAAALARRDLPETTQRLRRLSQRLLDGLLGIGHGVQLLGPADPERRAPHIVCVAFEGLRAEVLAGHLDQEAGVLVSVGSACSSHKARTSHVLLAMGVPEELAAGAVRFSLGLMTREDEVDEAIRRTAAVVEELSAFVGRGRGRG